MKTRLENGGGVAVHVANRLVYPAISLAVLALGGRWLAHVLDSYLVAIALVGLAIVSFAPFATGHDQHHHR